MSTTNYNWTWQHPRFAIDLTGDGRADLVGIGADGVWCSRNDGGAGFTEPSFQLAGFEANGGWRRADHPRFLVDLNSSGQADLLGFGDDGAWVALGNGDGSFQPARFVLQELGYNQGWRVDSHPRFVADLTGDGRADIIGFGDAGVWVALADGTGSLNEAKFVLPDLGRNSNHDLVVRKEIISDHRRKQIKHVFVLMLENRSYDHMLGFAQIDGTDAATGQATKADGLKGNEFNAFAGKKYPVIPGAPDVTVAPGHGFTDTLEQLCGRPAAYPAGGPYPEVTNTGFVSSLARNGYAGDQAGDVMRCFLPEHVPVLTQLAREFAVCDRWFSSMPGPTEPNRYFLYAATSRDLDESPSDWELIRWSTNHWGGIEFDGGHIFGALDRAGVATRIYAGDPFPVVGELDGVSNRFDVHDFDDFADDLQDEHFDAGFVHIEPRYFDWLSADPFHNDYSGGNSQHPSGGVAAGERLIKETYEAIRNSPHWDSSMLIVTYDEHGGFYDHVAPGPAGPTGSKGREHGFMFDQLGARVPAVVISPLIPKNTIEHRLLEHCSVIKTVCDLFEVPHLTHARDLGGVCGLLHLADLPEPRTDTPASLNDAVVSDISNGRHAGREVIGDGVVSVSDGLAPVADTRDSFIATTLRVAAVRNAALEPERKREIAERVSHITTRAEAAAYIKEVGSKLEASRPR
jgi:phospholipase C